MSPLRRRLLAAIALGTWLLAAGASAQIYRWTDAQGREHFTQDLQQVPPSERAAAEAAAARSAAAPSRLQTFEAPASRAPSRGGSAVQRSRSGKRLFQIPFERRGNAMFVRVLLNGSTTALFMVDTGASDVLIPAAVAAEAGIYVGADTPRNTYQTANGLVTQPVIVIDSVEVGEVRVDHVQGSISESLQVGLLGGSFFNHFTFQIDPGAQVITLARNDRTRGGLSELQWRQRFRETRGRLTELERYLEDNQFTREARVAQLERSREELQREVDALEVEADRAEVPQAWRE